VLDNFGGRKFIGFVLVSIMLFVLVLLTKISGTEFVAFITANLGIYCVANVAKASVE
jgi:hypothetical protein